MKNFITGIIFSAVSAFLADSNFVRVWLVITCQAIAEITKKGSDSLIPSFKRSLNYIALRFPSVPAKFPWLEFHQRVNRRNPRFCFDCNQNTIDRGCIYSLASLYEWISEIEKRRKALHCIQVI